MSDEELELQVVFLRNALRKLRKTRQESKESFISDFYVSDSSLHNLQLAIEVLTDIGNYLLKRDDLEIPETRADVFRLLCRHGFLETTMEDTLVEMSRFRNLVVHHYAAVSLETVYEILQENLSFMEEVATKLVERL